MRSDGGVFAKWKLDFFKVVVREILDYYGDGVQD